MKDIDFKVDSRLDSFVWHKTRLSINNSRLKRNALKITLEIGWYNATKNTSLLIFKRLKNPRQNILKK